jgi:hypothetical protein
VTPLNAKFGTPTHHVTPLQNEFGASATEDTWTWTNGISTTTLQKDKEAQKKARSDR